MSRRQAGVRHFQQSSMRRVSMHRSLVLTIFLVLMSNKVSGTETSLVAPLLKQWSGLQQNPCSLVFALEESTKNLGE